MRTLYTSPRIENVDRVIELLRQHGIAARITNVGSSWRGRSYSGFSYARDTDQSKWPQVAVLRAEDQPAARALLREAGIEPAVRYATELQIERKQLQPVDKRRGATVMRYVRLGLLLAIAVLLGLSFLRH